VHFVGFIIRIYMMHGPLNVIFGHKSVNNPFPPVTGTFNYIPKNFRIYDIQSHSVATSKETHFTSGT